MRKQAVIVFLILFGASSCVNDRQRPNRSLAENKEEGVNQSDDEPFPEIDLEIDSIVGIWKLDEIRNAPRTKGRAPITRGNDILMQITDKYTLAIASEGLEELKINIRGIPTDITLRDNFICGNDVIFKTQFKGECVKVLMVNREELLVEIDLSKQIGRGFMYKYYTRVN